MQPSLTQVPPRCSRSTSAVLSPASARRTARNGPAWPRDHDRVIRGRHGVSCSCADIGRVRIIVLTATFASLAPDRRRDRLDHARRHRELRLPIGDVVTACDPASRSTRPRRCVGLLQHEDATGQSSPEYGFAVRNCAPSAGCRRRAGSTAQRDPGLGGELGLVDFLEEDDALGGDVLLDPATVSSTG